MARPLVGARIAAVYELQAEWMEPRLKELGISWATFQLLSVVANAGDKASQIEVATRLGVTAATLSESVKAHVARGLIVQEPSRDDKRVRILRLTGKSEEIIARIKDLAFRADEVMTRGLLPNELTHLTKALDRMMQNIESALDRPQE